MLSVLLPSMFAVLRLMPLGGGDLKATDPADEIKRRVSGYLDQALPGVFYSEARDVKEGRVIRLFAVGTAPIRSALGAEDGLELARSRAQEAAREELVRFLATRVTVRVTARDEVVVSKEGDPDGVKETARKVERRTRETEESASAVIRGLRIAGARQVAGERLYVVVYRWDARAADAAEAVRERMEDRKPGKPVQERRVVVGD